MKQENILSAQALAGAGKTVGKWVECLDTVDSTNTYLKHLAGQGALHGTVVLAREQTGGRGRLGRSFQSARDKGLYLSVLLRPTVLPAQAAELTAWAAVAVCRAVERCTGLCPGIKWVNDLQLDGNIIGPAILGDRTGLSSFWVLFTIILCGGLWGVVGMIIAVDRKSVV